MNGVDGQPGSSATLWLTKDARLGTARTENGDLDGTGLALDVSEHRRIGLGSMLRVNHGAFLFGWLCTLMLGALALFFALVNNPDK